MPGPLPDDGASKEKHPDSRKHRGDGKKRRLVRTCSQAVRLAEKEDHPGDDRHLEAYGSDAAVTVGIEPSQCDEANHHRDVCRDPQDFEEDERRALGHLDHLDCRSCRPQDRRQQPGPIHVSCFQLSHRCRTS